jgi:hypothetical protein
MQKESVPVSYFLKESKISIIITVVVVVAVAVTVAAAVVTT